LLQIVGTPDAKHLLDLFIAALEGVLDMSGEDIRDKLVGISTDGASVNTGEHNGLISQLRRHHAPYVKQFHDCAHRASLAAAAMDECFLVERLKYVAALFHGHFSKR
jgi:hypothetical protein